MRLPAAPFAASSSDLLYVANAGNNSITVYHTGASGNTAPVAVIEGSKTKLNGPLQLSEDASGELYVANQTPPGILVFEHGANGNVAPLRVIAGAKTGLSAPHNIEAVTVDQATGKIFAMVEADASNGASELVRFAPNASGDEAPFATSAPDLGEALQIASDSSGKNIIYANIAQCCEAAYEGTATYEKQFSNGADLNAIYQIIGFVPLGIADDPTTKTYLVSGSDGIQAGIFRFYEDTVGYGSPFGGPAHFTPAIVSVITSDTCGTQMALGYERNIFVAHSTQFGTCATDAVYVYEHDASGNAKPLRIIAGSETKLNGTSGIYEGK